jgi:hypothetical protein
MLKITNTKVMNFDGAILGMRNPLESWDKSDSKSYIIGVDFALGEYRKRPEILFEMGEEDHRVALMLATAGSDHGKFLRQILVSFDITAPLYWWKEFDTYKVGTVANSTSTMHKLGSRHLVPSDFSWDDEMGEEVNNPSRTYWLESFNHDIDAWKRTLELAKEATDSVLKERLLLSAKNKWRRLIQDLPSSFNQTRTITANYEVLRTMYHSDRFNHKQVEWRETMMRWIESVPYADLITTRRKSPQEKILEKTLGEVLDLCTNDMLDWEPTVLSIKSLIEKALKL